MKVWGLWYGGSSYTAPSVPEDVEVFESLSAAREALLDRANSGHWQPQDFAYVNRASDCTLTPCAYEGCEMAVFFCDPSDERDPYPDRLVSFGPRGGVRVERV